MSSTTAARTATLAQLAAAGYTIEARSLKVTRGRVTSIYLPRTTTLEDLASIAAAVDGRPVSTCGDRRVEL